VSSGEPASPPPAGKRARKVARPRRKLRVAVLLHPELIPPESVTLTGEELEKAPWKTEHDVLRTLGELGHETVTVPVGDELGRIRTTLQDQKPHIVFNLLEGFADIPSFDYNVVAYLELLRVRYTGCNSRGLFLARDKAVAKQILSYHRLPVPAFAIFPRGRRVRRPRRLEFPLIVKGLTLDASVGISQASVVESDAKLEERVRFVHESLDSHALVERYVEGRELYVGLLGNQRVKELPVWELNFDGMPEQSRRIATERLKWSAAYQKRNRIDSGAARDLPPEMQKRISQVCRRVYRALMLNGYARVDLRLDAEGRVWVLEANPNPQLSRDEDFAQSARSVGLGYRQLIQRLLDLGLAWDAVQLG
jgi:D-alanine-D-alanine ligase